MPRQLPHTDERALPSLTEVAVYILLGAGIAGAVLIISERPVWYAAAAASAGIAIVTVLATVSARVRHDEISDGPPHRPNATTDEPDPNPDRPAKQIGRHGQRRRM